MKVLGYGLLATVSLIALTGCEQKVSEKDITKDGGVYHIQEGSEEGYFKFKDNNKLNIYSSKKKEIISNVKYKIEEKDDKTLLTLNMEDSTLEAKDMQYATKTTYVIPKSEESKDYFVARMEKQSMPYHLEESDEGVTTKTVFSKNKVSMDTEIKGQPIQYICNSNGDFSMKTEGLWMTIDKLGVTDFKELDFVKAAPVLGLSKEDAQTMKSLLMRANKEEKEAIYKEMNQTISEMFPMGTMKNAYKEIAKVQKELFSGNQVITLKKENKDVLK